MKKEFENSVIAVWMKPFLPQWEDNIEYKLKYFRRTECTKDEV